jgi:hypothetical protein
MLRLIDYLKPYKYLVRETDQQPAIIGHVNYLIEQLTSKVIAVPEVSGLFVVDASKGDTFKLVASSTGAKTVTVKNGSVGTIIIHYKKEGAAAGGTLDLTFSNVEWPGDSAPVTTSTDGNADVYTITFDGLVYRGVASLDYKN